MRKILLLLCYCLALAWGANGQTQSVSGKITDEGSALPGVSIIVKGTSDGAVSDADGKFTIQAKPQDVLVFSFIGFERREVSVGTQTTINVEMIASLSQLSEVVVIGYGEKSRELMTESIGTVGSKEIQQLPVSAPDAALQGRISGVQVTNVDGTPGSPVAIRIRGVGTTGSTQPLFVIDGIPVGYGDNGGLTNPLSTINPSDIESMSVLKDASATAVYGVRAANGVVLITTKRGKIGKPKITVDSYYGVQNFQKKLDFNNTSDYATITQEAINNRNTQDGLTPASPGYRTLNSDLAAGSPYLGVNTNWQDAAISKNARITNTNVGVTGGSDVSNYYVAFGYFGQDAMVKHYSLDRYSLRINSDYKIGSRFKFGETLSLSNQEVNRGITGGGDGFLYSGTANMPPFFSIYDQGAPNSPIPGNRYGYNGNNNVAGLTIANQFGINNIVQNHDRIIRMLGGIFGELEIIKGLKFRSAASLDFSYSRNTSWQPAYSVAEFGLDRNLNNAGDSRGENTTQVFTNTLTYARDFGDHSINILAGYEYQKFRSNGLSYTGYDFLSQDPSVYQSVKNQQGQLTNVNGGNVRLYTNAGSSLYQNALAGAIGRISYNYKSKYLLTASVRRDGTAGFSPQNRYGVFPAVSAAWRLGEEEFFKGNGIVSDLKVRGSWGQTGNQNISPYSYVGRVSFTPDYGLGSTTRQAPVIANFPNVNLGWETVETTDAGFDASFFDRKLTLLATYYNRNTKDFLYYLPIPAISGYGNTPVNAGKVNNRGIELEIGYNTTLGQDLHLGFSGNFTTVRNRLVSLAPGVEEFNSDGTYRTAVGQPIGYFYGYKQTGVYQNTEQAAAALTDKSVSLAAKPGDVIFQDNNGPADANAPAGKQFSGKPDGQIDANDRTYLGKTTPDFYYGFSINADYKGFDLSMLFQGVSGIQVYNQYREGVENLDAYGRNQLTSTQARWTGEGTSNSMPRAVAGDPYGNNRFSSRWIENAGFFRFKNIQLGYSIPQSLLSKTNAISRARFYIAATNLFRITKYTGLDPEVATFGSNGSQIGAGTDGANIPQPRTVQAGLQFTF
ncbi:MAG: TonB-dependent receptor [Chryseolinea sp.]